MARPKFDLHEFVVGVFKTLTDRDKQVKVGPSNLGSMCTRCLADDFLKDDREDIGRFWLGSRIGTTIHEYASKVLESNKGVLTEFKVVIGEIPGYGTIKGTTDLYVIAEKLSVDFKGTTRKKLALYQRLLRDSDPSASLDSERFKMNGYLNQLMLYGLGLENAGYEVENVAVAFIARDGTGDNDFWEWTVPYDRARAEKVLARGVGLWNALQSGTDPETLPSAPGCFYCETTRERKV